MGKATKPLDRKVAKISFHQYLENSHFMIYYLIVWKFQTKTVRLTDKWEGVAVGVNGQHKQPRPDHPSTLYLIAGTDSMWYHFPSCDLIASVATIMVI